MSNTKALQRGLFKAPCTRIGNWFSVENIHFPWIHKRVVDRWKMCLLYLSKPSLFANRPSFRLRAQERVFFGSTNDIVSAALLVRSSLRYWTNSPRSTLTLRDPCCRDVRHAAHRPCTSNQGGEEGRRIATGMYHTINE